jgi:polysaccharide export outer membrane protein
MLKNLARFTGIIIIIALSSCTTKKQLTYLQNVDSLPEGAVYFKEPIEYHIQNQDILYIKVISLNDEVNELINTFSSRYSQNMFQNEISLFLYGYSVNDSGFVDIPTIGKVNVLGKTLEEAREAITEKIGKSIRNATVIVKLLSLSVSVLGEVKKPGIYQNYNNLFTILEALSKAGDITDYGDRKRVLVIRPTKKEVKTFRVDLTDKKLLSSEAFFLLPNDIVYVEPIKSKSFRINIPTMTLVLSTVSTLILVLSFVLK